MLTIRVGALIRDGVKLSCRDRDKVYRPEQCRNSKEEVIYSCETIRYIVYTTGYHPQDRDRKYNISPEQSKYEQECCRRY